MDIITTIYYASNSTNVSLSLLKLFFMLLLYIFVNYTICNKIEEKAIKNYFLSDYFIKLGLKFLDGF